MMRAPTPAAAGGVRAGLRALVSALVSALVPGLVTALVTALVPADAAAQPATAQSGTPPPAAGYAEQVVDVPTRPGVTVRLLVGSEGAAQGTVLLFAGGHGGLGIFPGGTMRWGEGNFLVRSRRLFAAQGLRAVVVDAPSDRQSPPFLSGWRQRPEHVADVRALIAWARESGSGPVWLAGTSRGTQSVGFAATELADGGGPDGIVLSATILVDPNGRAVSRMPVERLRIPVLVVHHEQDGCRLCPYHEAPRLLDRLEAAPRKALLSFSGGDDVGDPCEARAHHGFNGQEADVVARTVAWMGGRP